MPVDLREAIRRESAKQGLFFENWKDGELGWEHKKHQFRLVSIDNNWFLECDGNLDGYGFDASTTSIAADVVDRVNQQLTGKKLTTKDSGF